MRSVYKSSSSFMDASQGPASTKGCYWMLLQANFPECLWRAIGEKRRRSFSFPELKGSGMLWSLQMCAYSGHSTDTDSQAPLPIPLS